uniref:CUB domain-containing protein n=1 Tax=Ditylenchus dipsaci TaxID=166011 RepID=A0A915D909_9BILA
MFTDPSCGLIEAGNNGVISLKNEAESTTFCQWALKADDPWKTFALEFEDLDLDDGNTLPGQKCGDQLYIYGVKGVENPIPCGPNDQSLIGESVRSNSNVLFIEYRGNRLPSRSHKGPTLKYRTIGSPVSNEIQTFSSQQVSSGLAPTSSSWWTVLALLPALLF